MTLTFDRAHELLAYNAETGVFTWKVDRYRRMKAGDVAGTSRPDGYRKLCIDGKQYLAHRVAWFMAHGRWPAHEIDHANLDTSDNRLCNLREAERRFNHANRVAPRTNTSGVKGVSWAKRYRKWLAQISVRGAHMNLGMYHSRDDAAEAYRVAAVKFNGQFARL